MPARVAYVTAKAPFGQVEAFVIEELIELRRQGVDVRIFPVRPTDALVHGDAESLVACSDRSSLLSLRVIGAAAITIVNRPVRSGRAILAMLVGQRPQVFVKNLAVIPKGLWLARRILEDGIEHVHAYWASTPATIAFIAAQVAGVPFSMTAHSWDIPEGNALAAKVGSCVFTRAVAEDGRMKLRSRVPGGLMAKVRVLHLGVRLPAAFPVSPDGRGSVLVPASLLPVKGHVVLIEALAILARTGCRPHVEFVGSGPLQDELLRVIGSAGLDGTVKLVGQLSHPELLARYEGGNVQLVVLPSVTLSGDVREGIPISLVEAMAHGIAVVASASGGIPELLEGAGSLVPERDPGALADAIRALLDDGQLRADLGMAGRKRVAESFDVVAQTRSLIEQMGVAADGRGTITPATDG